MLNAGNVGGELLDWIAMLGAVGERRPKFVMPQMEQGHAYAAWTGAERAESRRSTRSTISAGRCCAITPSVPP